MKKEQIRVIVSGLAGVGKSTVLQIIGEALAEAGMDVSLKLTKGRETNLAYETDQKLRIKAITKKSTVTLEERNVFQSLRGPQSDTLVVLEKD